MKKVGESKSVKRIKRVKFIFAELMKKISTPYGKKSPIEKQESSSQKKRDNKKGK